MNAKLSIVLKSFEIPKLLICSDVDKTDSLNTISSSQLSHFIRYPDNQYKYKPHLVRLPKTRALFTVLRSPHIDKKSREQFEMKIRTQLIVINTEAAQIRNALFRLKLQNLGALQYKIILNYTTRLKAF